MRTLKKIFVFVSKYKFLLFCTIFCIATSVTGAMIMPRIQMYIIDKCLIGKQFDLLVTYSLIYVGVFLIRVTAGYYQVYVSELMAQYVTYDIRNKLFDHIQRLTFTYHDETETGQLISRSTADAEAVKGFLGSGVLQIVMCTFLFAGAIGSCFFLDWKLSIATYILSPILGMVVFKYSSKIRPLYTKLQDQIGNLTTFINQNLMGIRVIKSFTREEDQINKFNDLANGLYDRFLDATKINATYGPLMDFLATFSSVIIFWYGGYQVIQGHMTIGALVTFNTYYWIIVWPIRTTAFIVAVLQNAIASADRIFEVLMRKPEKIKDGTIPMKGAVGKVEFKNVTFAYKDGHVALTDINLVVNPGELVGIIGATGSGKTTLVNLLPRFYDIKKGQILIDGINIKDYIIETLRRHIGIVAQETFLFGDSIKANIAYPRNAVMEEVIEAAKAANIHDFIMSLPEGYDTPLGERGVNLSGGQKQRMSIARALLLNPPILILDDSTSALDTHTEALIQAAMNNVSESRTTFMIAQRVSAISNADKIIVLDKGRIVEIGTHNELLALNGFYKEIYDSQMLSSEVDA